MGHLKTLDIGLNLAGFMHEKHSRDIGNDTVLSSATSTLPRLPCTLLLCSTRTRTCRTRPTSPQHVVAPVISTGPMGTRVRPLDNRGSSSEKMMLCSADKRPAMETRARGRRALST